MRAVKKLEQEKIVVMGYLAVASLLFFTMIHFSKITGNIFGSGYVCHLYPGNQGTNDVLYTNKSINSAWKLGYT